VDWYESQKQGLGQGFLSSVRAIFNTISKLPKINPIVEQDVRKAIVPKYPYVVLYQELTDCILIVSVFHTSRNPQIWQDRVTGDQDDVDE